jgi:hypothetical protein
MANEEGLHNVAREQEERRSDFGNLLSSLIINPIPKAPDALSALRRGSGRARACNWRISDVQLTVPVHFPDRDMAACVTNET